MLVCENPYLDHQEGRDDQFFPSFFSFPLFLELLQLKKFNILQGLSWFIFWRSQALFDKILDKYTVYNPSCAVSLSPLVAKIHWWEGGGEGRGGDVILVTFVCLSSKGILFFSYFSLNFSCLSVSITKYGFAFMAYKNTGSVLSTRLILHNKFCG